MRPAAATWRGIGGGYGGAGIGGGFGGYSGGNVSIGRDAEVTAAGGSGASAIGGAVGFGSLSNGGVLTIPAGAVLSVPPGGVAGNRRGGTLIVRGALAGGVFKNFGAIIPEGSGTVADDGRGTGTAGSLLVEPNNYELSFELNGGSGPVPANLLVYARTVLRSGQSLPVGPIPPPGKEFVGWFTTPTGDPEVNEATNLRAMTGVAGPLSVPLVAHFAALPPPSPGEPVANLALSKTASSARVSAGGQVTWQLVVSNHGPDEATGVRLEDPSPPGVTFEHAQTSHGRCTITTGLVCALESLSPHGQALVVVTATVAADASGPIVNRATVRAHQADPNETNNTAFSTVHVTTGAKPTSDLQITKRVDRHLARAGERLTYTITVTNHGPDDAADVRVTDTLALPLRAVSIHPAQGHCQTGPPLACRLGTLRAGAHTTITITGVGTVAGEETNTAAVISASRDPRPDNNLADATTRITPGASAPTPPPFTG